MALRKASNTMRAAEAVTGRRSWTLLLAGTVGLTALLSVDFAPPRPEPLRDAQGQLLLDADALGLSDTRWSLAVGTQDFNHDGFDDLAIGAPGEDGANGVPADMGMVTVIYGTSSGITGSPGQEWSTNTTGVLGSSEALDAFGATTQPSATREPCPTTATVRTFEPSVVMTESPEKSLNYCDLARGESSQKNFLKQAKR